MNRREQLHLIGMKGRIMPLRLERDTTIEKYRLTAGVILCIGMLASFAWSAGAVTVKHDLGVTTIPSDPKRVAAFDLSILDSIDALGVEGLRFAIPKQTLPPYLAKYMGADVVDAGGMKEPNLERLYEFGPDVIFISARQTDYYDKLSEIAPTVCANVDYKNFLHSFRENMLMLGDVFDVRATAESKADAIIARAEAIAEKAGAENATGLVIMVNDGAVSVYGPGSRFGLIHDVLKVPPADAGIRVSTHGQSVDFEYLATTNPDILFVINRNMAIGTNGTSPVLDNELVTNTKAGRSGKIINLDSAVWYLSGAGLESLDIMLGEVARALE